MTMNDQELMRHWLWMQAMEYGLNELKGRGKAMLYPYNEYDKWKFTNWRTIQHDSFKYVLEHWETPSYAGGSAGHSHYDIGYDLTANGAGVTAEYKDMTVTIKWPEVRRFIQKMLSNEISDNHLDLVELLAKEGEENEGLESIGLGRRSLGTALGSAIDTGSRKVIRRTAEDACKSAHHIRRGRIKKEPSKGPNMNHQNNYNTRRQQMEINVIISAPGLEAALNNLAASLGSRAIPAPAPTYIPVQEQAPATLTQMIAPITMPVAPPPAPVAAAPVTPPPAPVASVPVSYTQNDMAKACVQLMDLKGPAGQSKLQEIMAGLGVMALTQLNKDLYPSLAAALRAEGVNI